MTGAEEQFVLLSLLNDREDLAQNVIDDVRRLSCAI